MIGIISYGFYVPKNRLKLSDICAVWGKEETTILESLGVTEKAVSGADEDALTMAFEASAQALQRIGFKPGRIESIFVGSESHPYAVNPTSTILGEFLGVRHTYIAADLQFACKAATTGLIITDSLLSQGKIRAGLVVGSDAAQAKPHDILEYTAGAGACAFILGSAHVAVEIVDSVSYSTDTPDFWRRDGMRYPAHGGRFTGEPAYFHHVMSASKTLLQKNNLKPEQFDKCVFHMPNGKFPIQVAQRLGFTHSQIQDSLIVGTIGNPYTASAMLGLVATLQNCKSNELLFFCSYGSGAGSDAFILRTTNKLSQLQKKPELTEQVKEKQYISYVSYLKKRNVI
jgi:hydroxymethylglutaryl-CoA synthase